MEGLVTSFYGKQVVPTIKERAIFNLSNLTTGTNVAPVFVVRSSGTPSELCLISKYVLSVDLGITVNKNGTSIATITWPSTSAVNTEIVQTLTGITFAVGDVISVDITSSDGSINSTGIATLILSYTT